MLQCYQRRKKIEEAEEKHLTDQMKKRKKEDEEEKRKRAENPVNMRHRELVEEFKKKLGCVLWKTKANEYKEYVKNLRAGQFFSVAFKDGLQAGIRVSAAPETIIGGGWIVEAVEQLASFSQIRDGDILVKVNDKACIKYRYQRIQDMLSARSLANITLEFFRPAEIGANTSVNHTPSWMPPANPSTTMAPSMTPILKPSPLTQTPTLSPAYTQTVQIMKCSLGNNYLYGSNSEELRLLEITGKDSRISFDDVRTDIPFTLLFFLLLKIFILFYVKNLHGPAKNSVATVLPAELRQLPTSATKI